MLSRYLRSLFGFLSRVTSANFVSKNIQKMYNDICTRIAIKADECILIMYAICTLQLSTYISFIFSLTRWTTNRTHQLVHAIHTNVLKPKLSQYVFRTNKSILMKFGMEKTVTVKLLFSVICYSYQCKKSSIFYMSICIFMALKKLRPNFSVFSLKKALGFYRPDFDEFGSDKIIV